VVAHHRPAWWAVLEQGDRAGARNYVEGGCGVALAPPRRKRIRVLYRLPFRLINRRFNFNMKIKCSNNRWFDRHGTSI
jgi:hypothetical protein